MSEELEFEIDNSARAIYLVIVTYNRLELLKKCLFAIESQILAPDRILIIDNASSDGTSDWASEYARNKGNRHKYIKQSKNSGGAGGFTAGIEAAIYQGAKWIWIMDDDAEPEPDALLQLVEIAKNPANIYGSLAVSGADTAWSTILLEEEKKNVDRKADVPAEAVVQFLPFLGFMIHRDLVEKIGLPDRGFFIAADDTEYCLRAQQAGAKVIVAGKSHINHPKSDRYQVRILGRTLICLRLPPWKRYYDTRNRLLIARKYYGLRWLSQTIPGSFVRLLAALRYEPRKLAQTWAFTAGFIDGVLGIKGKRHEFWRITF